MAPRPLVKGHLSLCIYVYRCIKRGIYRSCIYVHKIYINSRHRYKRVLLDAPLPKVWDSMSTTRKEPTDLSQYIIALVGIFSSKSRNPSHGAQTVNRVIQLAICFSETTHQTVGTPYMRTALERSTWNPRTRRWARLFVAEARRVRQQPGQIDGGGKHRVHLEPGREVVVHILIQLNLPLHAQHHRWG